MSILKMYEKKIISASHYRKQNEKQPSSNRWRPLLKPIYRFKAFRRSKLRPKAYVYRPYSVGSMMLKAIQSSLGFR